MTSYTPHSTYSQTMASIMNKIKTKKVQKTNINTKKDANIMEQREEFIIINLPKNLAYLK